MTPSTRAATFVKQQETGGRAPALRAYKDGKDKQGNQLYSIGYGTQFYEDGTRVRANDVISAEKAESMFLKALNNAGAAVTKYVKVSLNQAKFDALTSFAYNIGEGRFSGSQLVKKINERASTTEIQAVWQGSFVTFEGKYLQGLADRRAREYALFASEGSTLSLVLFILIMLYILKRVTRK